MKRTRTLAAAVMACAGAATTPHAFAQSSVTLYGIVDEGLTYTTNQNGHSNWQMQSGVSQGIAMGTARRGRTARFA
jgi:predicted porin